MQNIKKILIKSVAVLMVLLIMCPAFLVSADSYQRTEKADGSSISVSSKPTYTVDRVITADDLGLGESLEGITEVFCSDNGFIYVLCGEKSKVYVLNKDYTFNRELVITKEGEALDFTGAQGIFVDKNSVMYIADTSNAKILVISPEGELTSEMGLPDSPLIPEDFLYQPDKILIDNKGYMYILAQGCYYGALMYVLQAVSF